MTATLLKHVAVKREAVILFEYYHDYVRRKFKQKKETTNNANHSVSKTI